MKKQKTTKEYIANKETCSSKIVRQCWSDSTEQIENAEAT